jgi:hypothetical protein
VAFVATELFANSLDGAGARGTLASDPGSGGTTLTLTTGHGARFPAVLSGQYLRLQCEDEIMLVTAHTANADTFTVTRGIEGTTGAAHAAATAVQAVLTAESQRRWVNEYVPQPRHHELLAWTSPPGTVMSVIQPTAGHVRVRRAYVPEAMTLSEMLYYVNQAGSGAQLPVSVFFGVYSKAGTLLGKTADQATAVQSTGAKAPALTAEAGQSLALTGGPDEYVWLAHVIGTQSTTAVQFRADQNASAMMNIGLVAADPFMSGNAATGASALPSSITPTSLTVDLTGWMAVR